ncbi:MAG: glycerol-3-phosphate acyltransferase [candidate division WOR-3 bacterium]|nr:glycerol-3-phosphate acyltransferase [candidate division WOR-3 bacterium]MDW7987917.1 glycerol-3-phosphate acyltransferase [candidate division WOR-3 bacterium]
MLKCLVAVLTGYLLGSVLPAYILIKIFKGADIRTVGSFNPGTTNIAKSYGFLWAVPTAIYDLSKGVIAILIAQQVLRCSLVTSYLAGFAAALGHIFPFYIGFRGGQGAATLTGIMFYNLYRMFYLHGYKLVVSDVVILVFVIMSMIIISQTQELISIAVLPLLGYLLVLRFPLTIETISFLVIISYLFYVSVSNIVRFRLLVINRALYPDFRLWRTLLRPFAMVFPILSYLVSKLILLTIIGVILGIFFIADIVRIFNQKVNKFLVRDIRNIFAVYKDKETARISSMTLFLLGCFLSFLLFERDIAITVIIFLIFGDLAAKTLGLAYGRHKLINKTFEGSLAHFTSCLLFGYIAYQYNNLPLLLIVIGAFIATLVELLPFNIDDNLSVPVITGAILSFFYQFIK